MAEMVSGYKGNFEKWIAFLKSWMELRDLPIQMKEGFDHILFKKSFSIKAPPSYIDFFCAMSALNWPGLICVEADEDAVCEFFNPEDVNLYVMADKYYAQYISESKEVVPFEISKSDYGIYSKEQGGVHVPSSCFAASYLVGGVSNAIHRVRILINPLVRFDAGVEWEAIISDVYCPYDVRFKSFADLVVWFYLNDPVSGVDLPGDEIYFDHNDDSSGLSKILFS